MTGCVILAMFTKNNVHSNATCFSKTLDFKSEYNWKQNIPLGHVSNLVNK